MATGLVRWNPWNDLFSLHNHVDQLFNTAFSTDTAPDRETSNLAIDIRQTDNAYLIDASVPGFTPEDIEVTFDNSVLTIKGRRDGETEKKEGGYLHRERRTASVFRQVSLPTEVRSDDITAEFNHGVLTVTVPRTQRAEPKRIAVTTGPKKIS